MGRFLYWIGAIIIVGGIVFSAISSKVDVDTFFSLSVFFPTAIYSILFGVIFLALGNITDHVEENRQQLQQIQRFLRDNIPAEEVKTKPLGKSKANLSKAKGYTMRSIE